MKNIILLIFLYIGITAKIYAQIPNSGFENWTNVATYYTPNLWSCLNGTTAPTSTFTCERGAPGVAGSYYLKLTSKTVSGMGVMPGIAVSGTFNSSTLQPLTGFPFNQRPANLIGKWQHMIYGSSQGFVDVQLTRWDSIMQMRMTVASAHYNLTGMAMSWSNFSIPLNYSEGNNPDSCIITFKASGSSPTNNDYLYIDELSFSGSVLGIFDVVSSSNSSIYPNPAIDFIRIENSDINLINASLSIYGANGQLLKSLTLSEKNQQFFVGDLKSGIYFLVIQSVDGTDIKKLIIQ